MYCSKKLILTLKENVNCGTNYAQDSTSNTKEKKNTRVRMNMEFEKLVSENSRVRSWTEFGFRKAYLKTRIGQ